VNKFYILGQNNQCYLFCILRKLGQCVKHIRSLVIPLWTSFTVLENWTFRKLDLFPSSGQGKKTPTLLGPLERPNLDHWTGLTDSERLQACNSKGLWRWCITLKIIGFMDFVHRPVFKILENRTFRKLDLFPSSGQGKETPTLLGHLERANSIAVSSKNTKSRNPLIPRAKISFF
jgi:hypothetical protein